MKNIVAKLRNNYFVNKKLHTLDRTLLNKHMFRNCEGYSIQAKILVDI